MRPLHPALSLLLTGLALVPCACAPRTSSRAEARLGRFHTEPLAAEASAQRRPADSDYAAKVRAALTARREDAAACFQKTGGARRPVSVMVSSPLYVSPGAAYFPKHAAASFMAAFERCMLEALERWRLPRPVEHYEGVWLRFHLRPLDAAALDPRTHSAFFESGDTQGVLELTSGDPYARAPAPDVAASAPPGGAATPFDEKRMSRPQLLVASPLRYSDEALALRVQGIMLVRCVLTERGTPENCRILEPLPYMERNVLISLYARRYSPALLDGKPMRVDYTFTIQLKLAKGWAGLPGP